MLNIYKARLLQICYVTCFCNVYAGILIKYQLHFDFLVVFTPPKALSTPLQRFVIIVLLKSAFLFFVLTSGRPLPVTTFFVFSKPLCSYFAVQIVIREFSALLQQRCLSLSKGFPLQGETAKICYCCSQPFCSSFVALLEVILQRCSFRTGWSTTHGGDAFFKSYPLTSFWFSIDCRLRSIF